MVMPASMRPREKSYTLTNEPYLYHLKFWTFQDSRIIIIIIIIIIMATNARLNLLKKQQ